MEPLSTYNGVQVSLVKSMETLNTDVHYMGGECSCKWALEEGMATHSRILVAIIPWAEGLGSLQFMVCKEST